MKLITEILSIPKQIFNKVMLEDGRSFILELNWIEQQQIWTFNVTFENFSVLNRRLVLAPNLLYKWKYLIPFGLMCISFDNKYLLDPFDIDDFANGRCQLLILTQEEVFAIEDVLKQGQKSNV